MAEAKSQRSSIRSLGRSLSLGVCFFAQPVLAQQIITSGQVESGIRSDPGPQSSPWNVGFALYVGGNATGAVIISDGGDAYLSHVEFIPPYLETKIGRYLGGIGSITVRGEGSSFEYGNYLLIGDAGTGSLVIERGARVFDSGPDRTGAAPATALGVEAGASGEVRVDGAGSLWEAGDRMSVGLRGTGSLAVVNGGRVSVDTVTIIGRSAGGNGTVTIQGAKSVFEPGRYLFVGLGGSGVLEVADGGSLHSLGRIDVGGGAGVPASNIAAGAGTGHVNIVGEGTAISAASEIVVGNSGTGTLNVGSGAAAESPFIRIGSDTGTGTINISDEGSAVSAASELIVGESGAGTLTATKGSRVTAPVIRIASTPGSTGVLNILGGVLETNSISFGAGAGTFNLDLARSYTLSAEMSGSGTFNVLSGTTVQTGDSSAFTGTTNLRNGALIVNGVLGGVINVRQGLLGGTGTAGGVAIDNGGFLAPGNSVGTLRIGGDLTFNTGSIYQVETDAAGTGDRTLVAGNASLSGGQVDVIASAGLWRVQTPYTILSAAGGLSGTRFTGVSSNLQFLDPSLAYDMNNVVLTLRRNDIDFAALAKTPNQRSAARSLDDFVANTPALDDNTLIGNLLGLDQEMAPLTFARLPGEIHVSLKSVLLEDSRFIREAANNRLRAALDGVAAPAIPVMAYGPDGAEPPVAGDRLSVWGQGFGSWADWNTNEQVPGLERSLGGFLVGGDVAINQTARVGALAGYSRTSIDQASLEASADIDNFHLGVYGGASVGALHFRSGASYTWHDVETDRSVPFTGTSEILTADYEGGTTQVFGELAYAIQLESAALEPFVNLSYADLHLDSFTETGGSAALAGTASDDDVTSAVLGLRVSTQLPLGAADVTLRGMAGWRHAFGDVTPSSQLAFAGMDDFGISGLPISRNAALLEFGLDMALAPATTFGLSYQGEIASDVQDHGFRADLTVRF
ncbi:autotransporter outer membrane beta-barrel domain-containing protein [Phyllobacterium endophyticum]|uniref:autotransporter outer membrane beta-barrel domain-containing protein n=1 Tax=Phyllobacterium endophyticum TaxID=1149773 RepID=UPI0011CCB274|nr:autotransporter domain-containing protein [Phyllobacterium endophyticum]TXR48678.1 autotransporter domain-containing protein [Phyllobacterium endophyticum]